MIAISKRTDFNIHFFQAEIALLDIKEIIISLKYADYTNIFLPNFVIELL